MTNQELIVIRDVLETLDKVNIELLGYGEATSLFASKLSDKLYSLQQQVDSAADSLDKLYVDGVNVLFEEAAEADINLSQLQMAIEKERFIGVN